MAGTFRFPPQHRLRSKVEFDSVFQGGARSADPYFAVLAQPNAIGHARLGLAIAKKSAKRAVDRNRLKRLARETFRLQADKPALDFVVTARHAAVSQTLPALRTSLENHLQKLIERCARR